MSHRRDQQTDLTSGRNLLRARFSGDPAFAEILRDERVMKAGDKGAAVAIVQQALMDMGFPMLVLRDGVGVSGVDGTFGAQTKIALTNFQVHAGQTRLVETTGALDSATMRALNELTPDPGRKAWDVGQPGHAPAPYWNDGSISRVRVVVVKDQHRTFLYDAVGACVGIFPNAHGAAGNKTDVGLKRIQTKIDEPGAKATSRELWGNDRSFGKRILNLSWASGGTHGEELHGTYDYANMGKDVSHGCVRHYNEDIICIFDAVSVRDLVAIVASINDERLRAA